MNKEYRIVEVKTGVWVSKGITGNYELTDKLDKAHQFDQLRVAESVARRYFGEVKNLKVTWEVE